jgi:hypothetical protein
MPPVGRSKAAQADRRTRMDRYCERLRNELIDRGLLPGELVGLRAGRLSDLVITTRARARRTTATNHPSARR